MANFKIATFNANSIRARLGIITDWLGREAPDVLCVQETKVQDKDFPVEPFAQIGYHCEYFGQKSYNGVAIITKEPPADVRKGFGDGAETQEQARLIAATVRGVPVVNTYVPQGFEPGSEKFAFKLEWFKRLRAYLEKYYSPDTPLIWTGDINVAPEDRDVYDPAKLRGHCGFHPDEQAALAALTEAFGFVDVFRKYVDEPEQYTFWDFRLPRSVQRKLGWRIDHIFATKTLAARSAHCFIDIEPRKLPKPSDHTFLVAQFDV